MIMLIGFPPTAKLPAVSNAMQLVPVSQLVVATPTPQCVGGPGEVVYGPVVLVTVINVPACEDSVGVPTEPLGVISMLLSRSPADLGLAWVSVSLTVSIPAPGVTTAVAAQASLQPPVAVKVNGVAIAPEVANNCSSVTAAPPMRIGRDFDLSMWHAFGSALTNYVRNYRTSAALPFLIMMNAAAR